MSHSACSPNIESATQRQSSTSYPMFRVPDLPLQSHPGAESVRVVLGCGCAGDCYREAHYVQFYNYTDAHTRQIQVSTTTRTLTPDRYRSVKLHGRPHQTDTGQHNYTDAHTRQIQVSTSHQLLPSESKLIPLTIKCSTITFPPGGTGWIICV